MRKSWQKLSKIVGKKEGLAIVTSVYRNAMKNYIPAADKKVDTFTIFQLDTVS